MKPSQVKTYLKACIAYNTTLGDKAARGERVHARDYQRVLLVGGVGVAKTSICEQASAEMGYAHWLHNVVHSDPLDLTGAMDISGEYQTWKRPAKLPREGQKINITIDEVGQGDRNQINAARPLCYDREVNGHKISAYSSVVCTANPVSARAGSVRIPNNFLTVVTQIEVKTDVQDFIEWARAEGLDERVLAFIANKGLSTLEDFDAAREINANPRTWYAAARALELGLTKSLEMEALAGNVGAKHMAEFYAFCQQRHTLPKPAEIFANPLGVALPENSAALYSVVTSLISAADYQKFKPGLEYISRTNSTEFVMFYLNGLAARDKKEGTKPAFSSHPEYNRLIMAINTQPTL